MLDICCINDVHESVVKFDSSNEEKKLKTWKVLMIKHLLPHSYMYLFRRAINIHINNLCGPGFNLYRFSTLMSETSLPNYTGKQKKCHIFLHCGFGIPNYWMISKTFTAFGPGTAPPKPMLKVRCATFLLPFSILRTLLYKRKCNPCLTLGLWLWCTKLSSSGCSYMYMDSF